MNARGYAAVRTIGVTDDGPSAFTLTPNFDLRTTPSTAPTGQMSSRLMGFKAIMPSPSRNKAIKPMTQNAGNTLVFRELRIGAQRAGTADRDA